jgi:hypothetical protein
VCDDLEFALTVERKVYRSGEPVPLTIKVTNLGCKPIVLRFSSGQRYDFVITREDQEVWRWSAGKAFTQALGTLTVDPGETLEFTEAWRQEDREGRQVPAGEYEVTGTVTTMGPARPALRRVRVEIG